MPEGADTLALADESDGTARLVLLGGPPFGEEIVMWWNFLGRSHDDIVQAREDWMKGTRFGEVHGYEGDPLPAPELPHVPLKPRGRVRRPGRFGCSRHHRPPGPNPLGHIGRSAPNASTGRDPISAPRATGGCLSPRVPGEQPRRAVHFEQRDVPVPAGYARGVLPAYANAPKSTGLTARSSSHCTRNATRTLPARAAPAELSVPVGPSTAAWTLGPGRDERNAGSAARRQPPAAHRPGADRGGFPDRVHDRPPSRHCPA